MKEKDAHFFERPKDLKSWFKKNKGKFREIWIGFYKKGYEPDHFLKYREATDLALCFGWSFAKRQRLDQETYRVRFVLRKPGGRWAKSNILRFKELARENLVVPEGQSAFENRKFDPNELKEPSFTVSQTREFKSFPNAWDFFNKQTKSYRRYVTDWVQSAKREETRKKRLAELIRDSGNSSKLQRILAAEKKYRPQFEPGKTPVEEAKNIGPICGAELRSVGIETVENLIDAGWEDAFVKLCEVHPHRLNLNMLTSLIGAVTGQSWKGLDSDLKYEAKLFLKELRRDWEHY